MGIKMKINRCGYDYRHPADFKINRPNGTDDYLLLILRSPSFVEIGGEKSVVEGNTVILFRKGTMQYYGALGGEFINDWIHFTPTDEDVEFIEENGIPTDTIISFHDVTKLSSLVADVCRERLKSSAFGDAAAELYTKLLILKIAESICGKSGEAVSPYYESFSRLRAEIYTYPNRDYRVSEIAAGFAMSISYFQHVYKSVFGRSITKDVISARMEYAKHLLISTDYPVSYISALCGYENDVHFMRSFKQTVKLTPTEYRKNGKM